MSKEKYQLSPMMQQYQQIKAQYPDCIIFYRLGDFYEMFFDDAVKASAMLDLTLTGRDCGLETRAPMCGVPFHSADSYISKLVSLGEKVAICEQFKNPADKNLVNREVVKVVTAGTVSDEFLDDKSNNFLMSVYCGIKKASVSWADITTGEFFTQTFEGINYLSELTDVLVKYSPTEIISNNSANNIFCNSPLVLQGILPKFTVIAESEFNIELALNCLKKQLNVKTLSVMNIKDDDLCICSAGALISYLKQTQMHALINFNTLKKVDKKDNMMLDQNTIRNLELIKTLRDGKKYGTLSWVLDKTKTSMGARKLQSWIVSPLSNLNQIEYRLDGVEAFYNDNLTRQTLLESLTGFRDIGRISGKISNNNLVPADCVNLSNSLSVLPSIKFQLSGISSQIINDINERIGDFSELAKLLSMAIVDPINDKEEDGQYIKSGYNEELDELRSFSKNSKDALSELVEKERELTGIKGLKAGYNRVFGYYLEVTNSVKDKVPYYYQRKQTLTNGERFVTEELKELEVKIYSCEDKANKLELELYNQILEILRQNIGRLKDTSDAIAELDVILSFALVSKKNSYVKPILLGDSNRFNVVDGRHPVVECSSKIKFIPNDCLLDDNDNRTAIITGPNMAGKSTYMRQNALIVLMAHIGCFVPAKLAEIPLVDRIFTRIGASDSLTSDQSTFMVEMSETAYILNNATDKSLVILDEIGRGTSTFDGLSIAWAVVEYITTKIGAKTLFATHYHELTELEEILRGVKNYKISVREMQGNVIFLRKIMRGSANRSFGIEVAELAGIDKEITLKAKNILSSLEKSHLSIDANYQEKTSQTQDSTNETERIIKDLDLNNLSPMQAFIILTDLYEKVSGKK